MNAGSFSKVLRLALLTLMLGGVLFQSGCSDANAPPDELAAFTAAMETVNSGDKVEGMKMLTECIENKPTHYAYLERARLYVAENKIPEAKADVNAGLAIDPQHRELLYFAAELEKPEGQRFKVPMSELPQSVK